MNQYYLLDTFDLLKTIKDNFIDLILVDPPYGQTAAKWDELLDFDSLWFEYNRILKKV